MLFSRRLNLSVCVFTVQTDNRWAAAMLYHVIFTKTPPLPRLPPLAWELYAHVAAFDDAKLWLSTDGNVTALSIVYWLACPTIWDAELYLEEYKTSISPCKNISYKLHAGEKLWFVITIVRIWYTHRYAYPASLWREKSSLGRSLFLLRSNAEDASDEAIQPGKLNHDRLIPFNVHYSTFVSREQCLPYSCIRVVQGFNHLQALSRSLLTNTLYEDPRIPGCSCSQQYARILNT
jgi:hypothetical protein